MIKPDSTQELTIDDWLDALEGVRPKRNGGHMALCPTHDDNNPSLSLDVGDDGTVLVKCFAGCEYESIKAAAGLNGHARPNRGGAHRKSKKPPKTYTTQAVYSQPVFEFKLPSGEVAYVQRHKGPYFRPIGGGKWVDQLGDVERIPYNLPGLLDGVRAGETVYHVEGCKDVDTATGWGLTATTTGGTNTWRSEYRRYYADADVVIVPDNDPPGFVYAETVAGDLAGVARSVKVVQLPDLPEGGDLTDFKEAGGTKEDLLAIVEAAPQWTASDETLEEDAPARTGGKPNQMDLVRRYRGREPDVAYGVGSWRRYERGVWAEIDTIEVEKGALAIIKEAIPEGVTPSSNLLSSVVNLLRVEVQIPPHVWADPDRGIIVCQNGTLELEGRKFREHRREDYALFSVAFDYDPDAKAEIWETAFKDRLGGSWDFLQEYAGYSLTTRTDLEAATFLVGPPGCGKSTFIEGLEMVAGDQAGTLSLSDMERSLYALSNIGGKTLLTATEAPHLYLKSTATLDALISGEKIQIERKYQQPERVRPVAKILWAMNELPQVRNPSAGLFRRAHIVPFPAVRGKREPLVKELIKTEGSGILNWALDGLDRLNAQRCFSISPEMREAMDNFKAGNDVPAAFVEECCKVGPEGREQSNLLYQKYKEWCLDNGYKPLASNRVRDEWERLGFEYKKIRGKPYYQGLEIKVAPRFMP